MLYKDMDDAALVAAYWNVRALLANASDMRFARQVFKLSRDIDIIVALARRRGLDLFRKEV